VVFIERVLKAGVGKFDKKLLREQYMVKPALLLSRKQNYPR
jgi:acyl-CoA synthetase (AMP-forming)/AMP-acid ligase II